MQEVPAIFPIPLWPGLIWSVLLSFTLAFLGFAFVVIL